MMSDIGGLIGICIGMSAISIGEVIQLVVSVVLCLLSTDTDTESTEEDGSDTTSQFTEDTSFSSSHFELSCTNVRMEAKHLWIEDTPPPRYVSLNTGIQRKEYGE